MNRRLHLLFWAALSLGVTGGRLTAEPGESGAEAEFFENRIRPVLVERCFPCHGEATKPNKAGGLRLDGREHLLKGGKSGSAAVPGNPDASLLIRAVRGTDEHLLMPPVPMKALTPAQVQDFVAWVKLGLPFPTTAKAPLDLSAARRFWSYQPIKEPPLPKITQADWPRASLDHFVLAKLEAKGMKPSPPADRRTLLRRATFDLTGLPPSAEEMEAFLADTSPEAYAKAVDRLLASSQYGVKWGRHWLDIARYGDTRWVGAGEDKRWPFAYTYRDWVIQALNEDMPYDRFVTLQLAADQVHGAKPRDQAALGFLTVGRWFTGTLPDVIDDQIDVVTRGLLGLTVQCARCHDHKYDPISSKDYYSLYGLFAASRMPVEGMGLMADLAEVSPRPVNAATENEIGKLREQEDRYLLDRLTAVRNEYRTPEKMAQYLVAAESVVKKTDNDVRALAKSQGLNEHILFRWVRYLQRTLKGPQPIFGPWHEFAALPEAEFAAKAAGVAEQEKAKKLNRHVAGLLTPVPVSLAELAKRYAQLLAKNDLPDPVTDADQEALRQVMRGNEAPVQVSPGELGQYLSKEETERVFTMRRALLTRLNTLSECADQYLAYQHEAAPVVAEVTEFLQKRRAAVAAAIRAPAKVAEYLLAARDAQGADEFRIKSIVNGRKLSDRLLRRWVQFLQRQTEDPVFAAWRAFAALDDKEFAEKSAAVTAALRKAPGNRLVAEAFSTAPVSFKEVAACYGELLTRFDPRERLNDGDQEALRQAAAEKDSPLVITPDEVLDYFTRKDVDELRNQENKLARLYLDHPGAAPRALQLRESPGGYAQKVFVRGNSTILGEDAPGRFLAVLARADAQPFHAGKGRWELAQAIVDPGNPLTARVIVNRVWEWHFGTGLVATPSDFGTRGAGPSHPELLDALARQFVADGWSLKKLHRRIMLSATYCQSSQDNPACRAADPENRLLWRMSRRRLTFEEFRDALLATAGRLDDSVGGRPIDLTRAGVRRRTVFGIVDRVALPGFYRYFDFPSSDAHTPERHETTIPQQALYLMNNTFVMDQAGCLARRTKSPMATPTERITSLYRLVFGRNPSAEELALGLDFVASAGEPEALAPGGLAPDAWSYGYGSYSESQRLVIDFEPFPFFVNGQWKGGPQEDDPYLGRLSLHARGGNAGRDSALAVIRRWTAPRDGKVSIVATLSVQANSIQPSGDGARGRIVASRQGQLGVWLVHGTEETTNVADVAVRRGDTIDFVIDARGRDTQAGFTWAPVVRMEGAPDTPKTTKLIWDAAKDFAGAPVGVKRPGPWERYAQVLLEANEFLFLD